jgi:hypothetical protein
MHGAICGLGHDQTVSDDHLLESVAAGNIGQLQDPLPRQPRPVGREFVGGRAGDAALPMGLSRHRSQGESHRKSEQPAKAGSRAT